MTDEQIREVCKMYADGASLPELFEVLVGTPDQDLGLYDYYPDDKFLSTEADQGQGKEE